MGDIVPINDTVTGLVHHVSEMTRQFRHPDSKPSGARRQRLWCVTVDEAVFVLSSAKHCVCILLSDAVGGVAGFTRQRLLMAQPCGQVVKVVIEPVVPALV